MPHVTYPEWWNLRRGTHGALMARHIQSTRDLIMAVNGTTTDDHEVVFASIAEVHRYCNTDLKGLMLHLKTAYTEKGVRVLGRRPDTVLYHIPEMQDSQDEECKKVHGVEEHCHEGNKEHCHEGNKEEHCHEELDDDDSEATTPTAQALVCETGWKPIANPIPDECYCPITLEVLVDPVVLEDGFTYERDALVDWLRMNNTSPMTGNVLKHSGVFFPNHALRQWIEQL